MGSAESHSWASGSCQPAGSPHCGAGVSVSVLGMTEGDGQGPLHPRVTHTQVLQVVLGGVVVLDDHDAVMPLKAREGLLRPEELGGQVPVAQVVGDDPHLAHRGGRDDQDVGGLQAHDDDPALVAKQDVALAQVRCARREPDAELGAVVGAHSLDAFREVGQGEDHVLHVHALQLLAGQVVDIA